MHGVKTGLKVGPHLPADPVIVKYVEEALPVDRGVGRSIVYKSHVCGSFHLGVVELNARQQAIYGIVCLASGAGAKLVLGKSVLSLGKGGQSGDQQPLEQF